MNCSIVWVIMGRQGYPQNAGFLVVLVNFVLLMAILLIMPSDGYHGTLLMTTLIH